MKFGIGFPFFIMALFLCLSATTNAGHLMPERSKLSSISCADLYKTAHDLSYADSSRMQAIELYRILADRYYDKNLDDSDRYSCVNAMNSLGYLYYNVDFNKSYECLIEGIDLALKHGYDDLLPYFHTNLANLHLLNASYDEPDSKSLEMSIHEYRNAFAAADKVGSYEAMCSIIINLTNISFAANKFHIIEKEATRFRALTEQNNKIPLTGFALGQLDACESYIHGNIDDAIDAFRQLNDLIIESPDSCRLALLALDDIYYANLNSDRLLQAEHTLIDAIDLCRKHGLTDALADSYKSLSTLLRKTGRDNEADRYELEFHHTADMLRDSPRLIDYEAVRNNLNLRNTRRELRDMALKRKFNAILTLLSLALSLTMASLLFFYIKSNRILRQKNEKLYNDSIAEINRSKQAGSPTPEPDKRSKYHYNDIDEKKCELIVKQISAVLSDSEIFCNPCFTIDTLASTINFKPRDVSQVINICFDRNFPALLSERRIKEACRRIEESPEYKSLTIEAIGTSVGFKSRSSFIAAFKKHTGLTPSEFLKISNNRKKDENNPDLSKKT